MTDALFDLDPAQARAEEPAAERISPTRRRTIKQARALASGMHPMSVYLGRPLKLHADAAPGDDRKAAGLRCRTCRFWMANHRDYVKCWAGDGVRTSFSDASDCRGWWPACVDYERAVEVEVVADVR